MNERMAVPVTMRALIQRINRKLRPDDQRLRTARGWFSDLGHYYILDFKHNSVVKGHVEPEALGRDLGVLNDGRKLELPEHLTIVHERRRPFSAASINSMLQK